LDNPSLSDYETEFGLVQYFLETRLSNVLRKNWNKKPEKYRKKNDPKKEDKKASPIK
jgi:hypothetical protein